ncbi:MAG: metallophosphoesterase [Pseudomonadota bacterium]
MTITPKWRRRRLAANRKLLKILPLLLLLIALPQRKSAHGGGIGSSTGIEIIRGPYLQYSELRADQMTIVWETSLPCTGAVLYGETGAYGKKKTSPKAALRHEVILDNLDPDRPYHYRVTAGDRFTGDYSFQPFPADRKSYRFIVYGDSRWGHGHHQSLMQAMKAHPSDFLIHTGDFVTVGTSRGQWDNFFFVARSLAARVPIFPVVGNHEYVAGKCDIFKSVFKPPRNSPNPGLDYYFDTGNARFIIMDNRRVGKSSNEQKSWLQDALESAKDEKKLAHRFVFFHQGIQSSGPHGPDQKLAKNGYIELLKKHDITLFTAGHDHMYERGLWEGIRYVVSGGGGAPVYTKEKNRGGTLKKSVERHFISFKVDENDITFDVVRADGSLIESCSLTDKGYDCSQP